MAVAALVVIVVPDTARSVDLGFRQSGIDGGGFVNVLAVDPSGSGVVIAGGDVSGLHRSTDFGATWTQVNVGLTSIDHLKVATVAFSPTTPGEVYAGVGDEGLDGGFFVSTDFGQTWVLRSATPQFSGGNNTEAPTLPQKHPRSTGRLIAFDPVNGLIYAGTFQQGVMRSADDGLTWTSLGYAGHFLRAIAIDPANPDVLYAAAYGEGIFKTISASTDGTFTKLPTSLTKVEDLLPIGSLLYAAAGPSGIQASTDGGATWSKLGGASFPGPGPVWMSIDGYELCGRTVLYAGADRGSGNNVLRSDDGGATWISLVADPTRIHDEIGGAGGGHWWMYGQASFRPGGSAYTASMVVVDPADPPAGECLRHGVYLAGRSGVWRATDAGVDWYPAVRGLGVSIVRAVAFDPAQPGRLFVGMADWVHLYSSDFGTHVAQKRPRGGNTAFDVEFNPGSVPGRVYVASGSPSANVSGEVFSNPNPATSGWTNEGLAAVAHGARPLAIAVRQVAGVRVLVVATEGNGIWRKAGTTWTHVSTTAMQGYQGTRSASMVWPAGGSNVYLYDHRSGVWRSNDAGKTWAKIWTQPTVGMHTGFVAADPSLPNTLWVSVGGTGLFRLSDANVGTVATGQIVPEPVGAFSSPGAIAVSLTGTLYVATVAQGGPAQLSRSDDHGVTFVPAGDALWAGAAGYVYDLEISPNGDLYAALNGDGLLRGTPAP